MAEEPLDAEKIRLLDQWAEGLQSDDRAELAAAGRAILMLIREVERLHVQLWDQRLNAPGVDPDAESPSAVEDARVDDEPELERTLRTRLRERWRGASAGA
jgi:hypothetical protein